MAEGSSQRQIYGNGIFLKAACKNPFNKGSQLKAKNHYINWTLFFFLL